MLKRIPGVYKAIDLKRLMGILLSLFTLLSGFLLTGISGWFIMVTGLTGLGLLSILNYNLFLPSAIIRFLAVGRPLLRYQERFFTHKVTLRQLSNSRIWIFKNILHMKKQDIIGFRSSDLAARIVSDVDEMDHFYLGMVVPWLSISLVFVFAGVFIVYVVPSLFWVLFVVYVVSGVLIPLMAFRLGTITEDKNMKMKYGLQNDLIEYLDGFLELKLFNLLHQYTERLLAHASSIIHHGKAAKRKLAFLVFMSGLIVQAGIAISILLILRYRSSPSVMAMDIFILLVLISLFETLQPVPELWYRFAKTTISGERLNGLVHFNDIKNTKLPFPVLNHIFLDQIDYRYGKRVVFDQLELFIREKRVTVITGANGTGKSTLLDLISGLKLPESGLISIGGILLDNLSNNALVKGISYMEQQVVLFDTSIYDNISIGKTFASANEVISAAVKSGLINGSDQSLDFLYTSAGKDGRNLSGGQARMISLARIILKDAPIVMFDEPTEGLDDENELKFINLLNSWRGLKTVIIVTHKESLVSIADDHLSF